MKEPKWTIPELEKMKEYSELDIYYEFLDVLLPLESDSESAALGYKAAKKRIRRDAAELKFLSDLLKQRAALDLKEDTETIPYCLRKRIEKEQTRLDNAESRYEARIRNLKKANSQPNERVERLREAMAKQKQANEERKKKSEEES